MSAPYLNLASDPGFESGTLGYDLREIEPGVTDATELVQDPVIDGDWSLRVAASATSTLGTVISVGQRVPASPGEVWSAGVWAGFSSEGMRARLSLGFEAANGSALGEGALLLGAKTLLGPETLLSGAGPGGSTDGVEAAVAPELLRIEGVVAPPEAAFVVVRLSLVATMEAPGSTTFDNLLIVNGALLPEHPIDGDRGGMEWLGSRFSSPSREIEEGEVVGDFESWTPPYLWAPKAEPPELE